MGLIASFTPGSIRSVGDMSRALQMVFADVFYDVVTDTGSGRDVINLEVDNVNDEDRLELEIRILDSSKVRAAREENRREIIGFGWPTWERVEKLGTGEADRRLSHPALTEAERNIVWLFKSLGIDVGTATRRLMGCESGVSDDAAVVLEAFHRSGLTAGTAIRCIELACSEAISDDEDRILKAWRETGLDVDEAIAKLRMVGMDDPACGSTDDDLDGDKASVPTGEPVGPDPCGVASTD
jgi:hypothetical protein